MFPYLAFSHSIICEILWVYPFIMYTFSLSEGYQIYQKNKYYHQNWPWRSIPWCKMQKASVFSIMSWKWWVHGALVFGFGQGDVSGGSQQSINTIKGCCWFSFRRCWFWLWLRQWRRWWWWQGWGCNGWLDNGGLLHWHSFRFWARHGFRFWFGGAKYAVLVITYFPTGTATQVSTWKHFPSEQTRSTR